MGFELPRHRKGGAEKENTILTCAADIKEKSEVICGVYDPCGWGIHVLRMVQLNCIPLFRAEDPHLSVGRVSTTTRERHRVGHTALAWEERGMRKQVKSEPSI